MGTGPATPQGAQAPQGTVGKPQTLNPSDPAEKNLPGVLSSPFQPAPGPPLPKFRGYLLPPSQSHTILVCPNAYRAQLECGVCVSVYTRLPRVTRPIGPSTLSGQSPGPLRRGRAWKVRTGKGPCPLLLPARPWTPEIPPFSSNLQSSLLGPVDLDTWHVY